MFVLLLLIGAGACGGAVCTAGETRCREEGVQVCDGAGHWTEIANCQQVSAEQQAAWACCSVRSPGEAGQELHACLPVRDCTQGDL